MSTINISYFVDMAPINKPLPSVANKRERLIEAQANLAAARKAQAAAETATIRAAQAVADIMRHNTASQQ